MNITLALFNEPLIARLRGKWFSAGPPEMEILFRPAEDGIAHASMTICADKGNQIAEAGIAQYAETLLVSYSSGYRGADKRRPAQSESAPSAS